MPRKVAIDNDFLSHLLEIENHPDLYELIVRFFKALDVEPIMHPLVYKHEINPTIKDIGKKLFDNDIISIFDLSDIWGEESNRQLYELYIRNLYRNFTGEKCPCNDVFNDWKKRSSLGEIHSSIMCYFLKWDCFLSDDGDAQGLGACMKTVSLEPIKVFNRVNCCNLLQTELMGRHDLNRQEIRLLKHTKSS